MNIRRISQVRLISALVSVLSLLAFYVPCRAETRSGFWNVTIMGPSADPRQTQADFSEFALFCSFPRCSLVTADVGFSPNGMIKAPGGILFDSALGATIQSQVLAGKTISSDREGRFYLDSMMKKRSLTAPVGGYLDSCPPYKSVYFLKTSEDQYATMVMTGFYIGGFDRISYYWAYRSQNDSILHKTALYEQPESLSIAVDVFSGRPNPTFTLKDSAAIEEIVHQIYVSVNTLLDSSVKRTETLQCPQGAGYRRLMVSGMFGYEDPSEDFFPSIEICSGVMNYHKYPPAISSTRPVLLYDPGRRLEKLIIRVCCRLGLVAVDSIGEVRFCDIIPDSLKDLNGERTYRSMAHGGKALEVRRLSGNRIVYLVKEAGLVRVNLFDTRGRKIAPVFGRYHLPGEHTLELEKNNIGTGVYLVDFRFELSRDHMTIPVVNRTLK